MFEKVKIKSVFFIFFVSLLFNVVSGLEFDKCIWIKSDSMKTKQTIDKALITAYEYGFDTVFVQVRYRGEAFYESKIVSKSNLVSPDFDPLLYAVQLAHSLGIEIHAWFNTYILWSSSYKPFDHNHIYVTKPDWLESNIYGKSDSSIDISVPQSQNWEGIYLSPNHPSVNKYLIELISEIIDSYDIDGIHLDYIRFQDDIYGFNDVGRKIFKNNYGFDPLDIERNIISIEQGWTFSQIDSLNEIWNNYKIGSINTLVDSISEKINIIDRNLKLSAAVKSNPNLARKKWSQDWKNWILNDYLDFVVVMNYAPNMIDFNNNIQSIKEEIDKNKLKKIIMGVSIYNQGFNQVSDKIYISYINDFKGVSLFSFDNKKEDIYWFDNILDIFEIIK